MNDECDSLTSTDNGDIYREAENLLQKDYSVTYNEATSALNRRVEDEQKQLNDQRTALLAKRRLKKSHMNVPHKQKKEGNI